MIPRLVLYALLWASFGVGHSLLAARPVRRIVLAAAGRWERLLYCAIAALHLAVVLQLGRRLLGDHAPFDLPGPVRFVAAAAVVVGGLLGIAALAGYDLPRFIGLAQLRSGRAEDLDSAPPLHTSGLHRHIRHPLYTALLLVLWGGATTPLGLATALCASAYLAIGMRLEDAKLRAVHGAAYEAWRRRTPALLPRLRRPG